MRHPDDDRVLWPWIGAAFAVAVLMWLGIIGVGVAVAAPAPRPDDQALVQAKADEYAAWLSATLRADVPRTTFTIAPTLELDTSAAERYAYADGTDAAVKILPDVAAEFTAIARRGVPAVAFTRRDGAVRLYGVHVILHELLHRPANVACWGPDEEGITDAVTVDLMAAWGAKFLPRARVFGIPVYEAEVARIRAASARATGSPNWRTRAARTWVRQLWGASCSGRAAMLAQAA